MQKVMLSVKKLLIFWLCLFMAFGGGGCHGKQALFGGPTDIGPPPSSEMEEQARKQAEAEQAPQIPSQEEARLDVIIPVFDPGIPVDSNSTQQIEIWPELRRAEANRFAYKLKLAIEETDTFGAVRVTPDATATGDLYVMGVIKESDGEDVGFKIIVTDISGYKWFSKSFSHKVDEKFHADPRNAGKDPYDPAFTKAAEYMAKEVREHDAQRIQDLKRLTAMRFGMHFSDEYFSEYVIEDNGDFRIKAYPHEDDPMLERIRAIRLRDQLFVDGLQDNYRQFNDSMNTSYLVWQKSSLDEKIALAEVRKRSFGQALGGILLIGLGVAAVALSRDSDPGARSLAIMGGAAAGALGAGKLIQSYETSQEADYHKEAIQELGNSLDIELQPQVVEFREQTIELTGSAKEQFATWRAFLKKIYEQEKTPNVAF